MTMIRLCLCCLLCVPALVSAAEYYRWVDENGNAQFTQTPPPDGLKADKKRVYTAPASSPSGKEWLESKQKSFKNLDKDRVQTKEREEEKRQLAADNARDCAKVQRRLKTLSESQRVQAIAADGKRSVMTAEARQAEVAKMQGLISKHCR